MPRVEAQKPAEVPTIEILDAGSRQIYYRADNLASFYEGLESTDGNRVTLKRIKEGDKVRFGILGCLAADPSATVELDSFDDLRDIEEILQALIPERVQEVVSTLQQPDGSVTVSLVGFSDSNSK